jgi:hypothetical protein
VVKKKNVGNKFLNETNFMLDVKKILKDKPGSFVSYFIPLLVLSENNVQLIDVITLYGLEKLEDAIEKLGGSTVTFPTWNTIDTLVSDAYLLSRFDKLINTIDERRAIEEEFDAPFQSLRERVRALRSSLIKKPALPGDRKTKQWLKNLESVKEEISSSE